VVKPRRGPRRITYLTSVCLISEDPAYNDYREAMDVLTRIQYP